MKAHEFCYWLQGFFEISNESEQPLSKTQVKIIQNHLNMVFIHDIDPSYPNDQQDVLNTAHTGNAPKSEIPLPPNTLFRC